MTWGYFLFSYLFVPAIAVGYVLFAGWAGYRISKFAKNVVTKSAAAALALLVLLLLPVADVIKGRMEFNHHCSAEAGVTIHKTVSLQDADFRSDGYLKRELLRGPAGYRLGTRYRIEFEGRELAKQPRIERSRTTILDIQTGEILGEVIDFLYWGGWFANLLPGHMNAERCSNLRERRGLEAMVFTNYPHGK